MDELMELRRAIVDGRYSDALHIVDELGEMAKEDKTDKVFSYMQILLIHLIKQKAEQRTSRSWDASIQHSIHQIGRVNKRRKAVGRYMSNEELLETLHESFTLALTQAALEAFGGVYSDQELLAKVDKNSIVAEAMRLIEH